MEVALQLAEAVVVVEAAVEAVVDEREDYGDISAEVCNACTLEREPELG